MKSARSGFTGLALVAMLFLSGCQNTITSIQLPDLSQVTWRVFVTGFTYGNDNLTVQTTGSSIDAELQEEGSTKYCGDPGTGEHALVPPLDDCPVGFDDFGVQFGYLLAVEVGSQFTSGSITLMDGLTEVRTIPISVGAGRQIVVNYAVGNGIIPYPFQVADTVGSPEAYFSDNFTVVAMFPPDPGYRSNIDPLNENEEALLALLSSGQGLCLSSSDFSEGADVIAFDISQGSGSVSCGVDLLGIPTLSTWMLGGVALMLAGLGVVGVRRQRRR